MSTPSPSVVSVQPTPDQLRAFLLGKLPQEEAKQISDWVEACPDPDAVLAPYLVNDTLCDALGQGSTKIDTQEAGDGLKQFLGIATIETTTLSEKENPVRLFDLNTPEYQFARELGRGGMGIVCEAEELKLHRRVAIKMMLPDLATRPDAKLRFLREARMMATVTSDHIVPVFHIGENQTGVPFLVMPLLEGETLEDRLQKSPLSINEILTVAEQMAQGLVDAHAKGLIHRDIKPSNLWLESHANGSFRRVRILDFGLARPIESEGIVTGTHTVMGTPAYMSPEQARGDSLDARTDLFSAGVLLYRLCTGRLPFQGPNVLAILTALAVQQPKLVREINPEIPVELATLIHRLLAKSPEDRLANSKELLDSIQGIKHQLSNRTIAPAPVAIQKKSKGLRIALGSAFAALALLIVGGIVIIIKDKDGKVIGTLEYPDGTKVEVTNKDGKGIGLVEPKPEDKKDPKKNPIGPIPTDADRIAAEKILSLGGSVLIRVDRDEYGVKRLDDLPKKHAFVLTGVSLLSPPNFKDDDFACFKGLTGLTALALERIPLKAKELAYFKDCKKLTSLTIENATINLDEGLVNFKDCVDLVELNLSTSNVTNKGLEHFKTCTKLQTINLFATGITDEGLESFKDCRALQKLILTGCDVRSAGMVYLKDCTELRHIELVNTKITGAGLKHLKNCKKMSFLTFGGGLIENEDLKPLSEMLFLEELYLSASKVTPEGLGHLKGCVNLKKIDWGNCGTEGGFQELSNFKKLTDFIVKGATDEVLASLGKHPSLQSLVASRSMITEKGLGSLKGVKTLRSVSLEGAKITPEGVTDFQKALPECNVLLDGKLYAAVEPKKKNVDPSPTDADRIAAEKILSLHCGIKIQVDTDTFDVTKIEELPKKAKFVLIGIRLKNPHNYKDGDLACFKGLKGLTSIYINGDFFKAQDLQYFKDCKNLTSLHLEYVGEIDRGLVHFAGCHELVRLVLTGSIISDAGLDAFKNCTKLRTLNLSSTKLTDEGLEPFKNCRQLEELALDNCVNVRNTGFAYLKDCTELKILNLHKTLVAGGALKHLKNCRKLTNIDLTGCPIQNEDLAHIKDMTMLEHLLLRETNISDDGIEHLKGLTNIKGLSIMRTKVTGKGIQIISEFKNLEWLDAVSLNINDEDVKSLQKLSSLKSLMLEECSVTDKAFETFKEIKSLETLNVSGTKVTQKGVDEFKKAKPRCAVFSTTTQPK